MKNKIIFVSDDSIDGIFTAIYMAWSSNYGHDNIMIETKCSPRHYSNLTLFSEYRNVDTDFQLSMKVASSIRRKISEEAYEMVCRTALSEEEDKADLIYRFLILGFAMGTRVLHHLSNETVNKVFKINKYVNNEAHHLLGFVRFSEQENGLLTSIIHPRNNVLSLITPHFADRLPLERFVIVDGNRSTAALHVPGKPWILADMQEFEKNEFTGFLMDEDEYKDLWKIFFHHIAIKERMNPKLQRNNLPLRFRGDMTEFHM